MVREKLLEFEGTKHHFMVDDSLSYQQGDQFVQKDLSLVLKAIAEKGKAGFYEGEVAQKMVEDFQANGGIVTLDDLKNYQARESRVLTGKFRGHSVQATFLLWCHYHSNSSNLRSVRSAERKEWAFQQGKATALAYSFRKKQVDSIELNEILSYEKAKMGKGHCARKKQLHCR